MIKAPASAMISSTPSRDLYTSYDDPSVPLRELLARVWRAGDSDGWLTEQIASPVAFRCLEIARESSDARGVVLATCGDALCLSQSRSSSPHYLGGWLALGAATKALSRALDDSDLGGFTVSARFAAELLGTATVHQVWQNPATGLLGNVSRARTLREARWLAEDLSGLARRAVLEAPPPHSPDHETFSAYVRGARPAWHQKRRRAASIRAGVRHDLAEGCLCNRGMFT